MYNSLIILKCVSFSHGHQRTVLSVKSNSVMSYLKDKSQKHQNYLNFTIIGKRLGLCGQGARGRALCSENIQYSNY